MAKVKSTTFELPEIEQLFALHQSARVAQDTDKMKQIEFAVQRLAAAESAALEARILTLYHQETNKS